MKRRLIEYSVNYRQDNKNNIIYYLMNTNTPTLVSKEPTSKSMTSGFELQTKIRLIIQDVLSATIRKLSHFGQKIEKFEEYFITFRERFQTVERERTKYQQGLQKIQETQMNIRRDLNMNEIRYNEDKERNLMGTKQQKQEHQDLEKIVKTLVRQNENINLQLGKTKNKFLEYSNVISTVKEEVSWKITKYLQETAESHTQMKVYSENMKNEYFNITLLAQKQKEKYDDIVIKYQEDKNFKQEINDKITEFQTQIVHKRTQMQRFNTKIDDLEFSILSKIKTADAKFDSKMGELQKNNSKLTNIFKKMDNFSSTIQNLREEMEHKHNILLKRNEEVDKKTNEYINDEILKFKKENGKTQKIIDKKFSVYDSKIEKLEDFFLQKLQFLKMEVQSQIANKTSKIIEQKTKNDQNINNSTIQEINSKFHKMQIQTNKTNNKLQAKVNESIAEVKKNLQQVQDFIDDKIQQISSSGINKSNNNNVSKQRVQVVSSISNEKISQIYKDITDMKFNIQLLQKKQQKLQTNLQNQQKASNEIHKKQEDSSLHFEQKINNKIQKVMFLVTKMRGDMIIRNEFNEKETKQLRKNAIEYKQNIEIIWKIIPGISQCINLVLSLIFDAEFQHSKIIQDNLPLLTKDGQKFNTICQGVIYEFKEKKKPGNIMYRHAEIKKIDIVKATFFGFIQLWEELFVGFLKNKQFLLPKTFYKRIVQKNLKYGGKYPIQKQIAPNQANSSHNIQQPMQRIISSTAGQNRAVSTDSNQPLNNSFYIRKSRKGTLIKQKERQSSLKHANDEMIDIKQ